MAQRTYTDQDELAGVMIDNIQPDITDLYSTTATNTAGIATNVSNIADNATLNSGIVSGAGLEADGSFDPVPGSPYGATATDIKDYVDKVETQVKINEDLIQAPGISGVAIENGDNPGYLKDKLIDSASITHTLAGAAEARTQSPEIVDSYVQELIGLPSGNLLTNSGFSANSQSTLEDYGTQITLTDVTAGVCSTADTQDIAVGDLFRFDSGDHDTVVGRVTDVTVDVSFTLSDTSLTDSGSPGTGYEAVPGYVAADSKAPDGWSKIPAASVFIVDKSLMFTPNAAAQYLVFPSPAAGECQQRTMTIGAFVTTSTASHARLRLFDGITTTYSDFHSGDGLAQWLEVTLDVAANATQFTPLLIVSQTSGVVEITQPRLIYGPYIGEGNYAPIPQEYVPLDADVVYLRNGVTLSANEVIDVRLASEGKISSDANALYGRISGQCASTNKVLGGGQSYDVIARQYVTGMLTEATGKMRCETPGEVEFVRTDTFTNAAFRVIGVYL